MSRGFVKEDDLEHAGTDLPERPISTHPNYVTTAGYAQLQQQLSALEKQHHVLSANKDAPSAQQQLAIVNRDLRYYAARTESAILSTPPAGAQAVLFGHTVATADEDGNTLTYQIVGEDEADIKAHKISWVSPLAKALIGHKIGESVVWKRPAGDLYLEIVDIS